MIVPYGAGTAPDIVPRMLVERMAGDLGQAIVIDNRPGGLGLPAINEVLNRPADGSTLFAAAAAHWAIVPAMQTVPYDFLRDFAPVTLGYSEPQVIVVSAASPYNSLPDLMAFAKANPGKVNYGSGGNGTLAQLQIETMAHALGVKLTHIPYKGSNETLEAILRDDIQLTTAGVKNTVALVKAGKVRLLAVTTGKRSVVAPDLPTVAELTGLKDFDWVGEQGYVVRAGTPRPLIDRLNASFTKAMVQPDLQKRLIETGAAEFRPNSPEQFGELIRENIKRFGEAVRLAGLKPQ